MTNFDQFNNRDNQDLDAAFHNLNSATAYTGSPRSVIEELAHRRSSALAALAEALKSGYSPAEALHEPELASLRQDLRYADLVAK